MNRHGFSIGMERNGDGVYLALKAMGTLTHDDYQQMTPLLNAALQGAGPETVDAYLDLSEFDGWQLRAAWDDFRLGLKHGRDFRRIAIFGSSNWHQWSAKIAGWFISGEVRYFDKRAEALAWLSANGE